MTDGFARPEKLWHLLLAVAVGLLGVVTALNWRITREIRHSLAYRREVVVSRLLRRDEIREKELRREVYALRLKLRLPTPPKDGALREKIERIRAEAGFAPLRGPGISLLLGDSSAPSEPGENPNVYLLHDSDLLRIVNDLRAAGARGVALNGERLLATSEIRCAGPTISVNGRRIATPVRIQAVGNPARLAEMLYRPDGLLLLLGRSGFFIRFAVRKDLTLPGFSRSPLGDTLSELIRR